MKNILALIILATLLFSCSKENNHSALVERLEGLHVIGNVIQNDSIYSHWNVSTTPVIYFDSGKGEIDFQSDFNWQYQFEYWTVENDVIYILDGALQGNWRVSGDMSALTRLDDPTRTVIVLKQ
jgi:hypothetical protein